MEIYFFANSGNFHKFQQPDQPSVIWDSLVRIVSRQRSILHEYSSVRIRRSDSWMKNSTCVGLQRVTGRRPGHELLIRCSADFAREGLSIRRRFTDERRRRNEERCIEKDNFRKSICKINQVKY